MTCWLDGKTNNRKGGDIGKIKGAGSMSKMYSLQGVNQQQMTET